MSNRTSSEQIWTDLETQLAGMSHQQLVQICSHLIRTYVVESRATTRSAPAEHTTASEAPARAAEPAPAEERSRRATPTSASPFGGSTPKPQPDEPPRDKPKKKDSGYNKLEMD